MKLNILKVGGVCSIGGVVLVVLVNVLLGIAFTSNNLEPPRAFSENMILDSSQVNRALIVALWIGVFGMILNFRRYPGILSCP